MRILNVIPYYYPELKFGGPPLKVHSLARCIREAGPEVTVLTFDSERPHRSETTTIENVTVRYLPWTGHGLRQFPGDREAIADLVRESDLTHLYGLYTFICPLVARVCRKLAKPYLCEPLGMFPPRGRNRFTKEIFNALVTKRMFAHAERIVAASEPEQKDLAASFPPDRIVVRRNGIDIEAFRDLPPRDRFLNRHSLDPGKRYLTYLGRISPIKKLEAAIEAFKMADPDNCDFLLVGPALEEDYARKLKASIRRLNLDDRVHVLPPAYRDEKLEVFAASDAVILPSVSESFGNSAGEGGATGLPALITMRCGIASSVDGRTRLAGIRMRGVLRRGYKKYYARENAMINSIAEAAQDVPPREKPVATQLGFTKPFKKI